MLRAGIEALGALGCLVGCDRAANSSRAVATVDTTAMAAIAAGLREGLASGGPGGAQGPLVAPFARARALNPEGDELTYLLAFAHAARRDTAGAAGWLDTLAARGSCLAPERGRSFASVEEAPAAAAAIARIRANIPAQHRSSVAFTLPRRDLYPEGIAYDPVDQTFFLSSLRHHLVLRVTRGVGDREAATTELSSPSDSLWSTLGMKVDSARRRLWVATTAEGFAAGESKAEEGRSAVVIYDLATGKRLKRLEFPRSPPSLANDLALDREGNAFVTDTREGALYRVGVDGDSVETYLPAGTFAAPNGIVVTPDGATILVGDNLNGIWVVDRASGARRRLPQPAGVMPLFVDGIDIHRESVVAVVHALSGGRVLRFRMRTPAWDAVLGSEVLDCNNPLYRQPTTGVVVGDTLFYIATSQFGSLDPAQTTAPSTLVDITVLALPLGR